MQSGSSSNIKAAADTVMGEFSLSFILTMLGGLRGVKTLEN